MITVEPMVFIQFNHIRTDLEVPDFLKIEIDKKIEGLILTNGNPALLLSKTLQTESFSH